MKKLIPIAFREMTIRQMQTSDVDAVRELDSLAFIPYLKKTGRGNKCPMRTRENVLACLALNPTGCFVVEDENMVGFVFTRRWGRIGWLGTFGVHPDWQGRGVGGRLLTEAVAHLEATGCTTIGLETMSDSPHNVGLYTRAGFRPIFPTLVLERRVILPAEKPSYTLLSQVEERAGLASVSHISGVAWPGLDYASDAHNASRYDWGDTLLVGWPTPWGAAVVRTVPKQEGVTNITVDVSALVVPPEGRSHLGEIIRVIETYAGELGLQRIRLAINAKDWETLQRLLELDFRVVHLALRLICRGDYCPAGIDLSRWAM